jgi:Protein of unknown function DUF262
MKKTKIRQAVAAPPPAPPRERFVPSWYRRSRRGAHAASYRAVTMLRDIEAGAYRLPRFQRPWRWSDADVIELMTTLFAGGHVGTLLTWDRSGLVPSVETFGEFRVERSGRRAQFVVDGQQRLGALCTAVHSGRFFFDLETGIFVVGDGAPWLCPVREIVNPELCERWFKAHAAEHGLDQERVFDAWAAAYHEMSNAEIHACTLSYAWTLAEVVDAYRRINTTGVRVSAEDLEDGLRRALDGS